MNIDFNNVRKRAAYALDDLTKKLNRGILKEREYSSEKGEYGNLLINKEDIQQEMDELHELIWAMLCIYDEKGDPNFKCVYEEVEKNGGLCRFNDKEEE